MSDQTKLIDRIKALLAKAKGRAAAGQVSLARQMGSGNQLKLGSK